MHRGTRLRVACVGSNQSAGTPNYECNGPASDLKGVRADCLRQPKKLAMSSLARAENNVKRIFRCFRKNPSVIDRDFFAL